ncbi:hypothetical protein ASPZODRAFT_129228 [Penicilliopsis zonata CBS 506.65]|uniref:Ysc84 actin-binding domain-containing protein n=1 Tax=Penicilliopsis zonata CBS 506.65 TaxID=1073090 RepID=A0A1L9SNY3_9EURO|nr:hypothetical protein ASPZODRAFT_129228 [Penicilliopsis zonata CBS 506.65]OJJ48900.1 hypothetical protein ASPZODRAFT_129228 [Penicilliopsis zonata CBS 506.65]
MPQTTWEKTKGYSKKGFDKAWHTLDKLGAPVNRLSNRVGAEAFWPMTLDKESDKAARILRSFCKDGFYGENKEDEEEEKARSRNSSNGKIDRPAGKQRVLKKIPTQVIQRAKGLAIFTTMRTGLWVSGSGGSGVLLARIPETGEWSPPSGILLHTAGIGFLAGVDIYDCVVVINTLEALEAFKRVRCTLGGEVSAAAGPVGMGGVLDSEVHKRQAPIWTYMKSRGLYAGVQVDGTIIIERTDENERFYGERLSVTDILAGKVRHPPPEIRTLLQTIKAAQGDGDVDESLIPPPGDTPGDVDLDSLHYFGVPAPDDPDPFGVKALEAEGLFIREAGTKIRPSQEVFEFRPNPSSPIFSSFSRRSIDSSSPRNSWRASVQSHTSVDRGVQTEDRPPTATSSRSRTSSLFNNGSSSNLADARASRSTPWDQHVPYTQPVTPEEGSPPHEEDEDEVEVHEVISPVSVAPVSIRPITLAGHSIPAATASSTDSSKRLSPTFTRARLVTIPKRSSPPALPPRNPQRASSPSFLEFSQEDHSPVANGAAVNEDEEEDSHLTLQSSDVHGSDMVFSRSSMDKDEFHSISSAPESDVESPTEKKDMTMPQHRRESSH